MNELIATIGGPPQPILTAEQQQTERQKPQLGREVIESERLKNVQTRKDMLDDEIMRQALVKASQQAGDNHQAVPDLALRHFISGGGSSKRAQAFISFLDTHQQNLLKMKGEELQNAEKEHDQLAGLIGAVTQQKDPEMQSVAYRAMLPNLPSQLQQQLPKDFDPKIIDHLKVQEALLRTGKAQFAEATKRAELETAKRQAAAHELTAKTTAEKTQAEIPGIKAKSEIEQKQAEAMRAMTPESIDAQVDAILPVAKYGDVNNRTKQLVRGAMSMGAKPETVTALLKDAADQIGRETPEKRFIRERMQQGSTYEDAVKAYAIASQAPQRPPQTIMMVPGAEGGLTAQLVRPGSTVGPGAMTAAGANALAVPTAATRTMAEAAPKVIALADRVEQLVNQQEKFLGPGASRWSEFMAGKVGAPNAEFTKLRSDVMLLQTMLMRMHVGARGGQQMMGHFKELLDSSKQSPENLRAALGEIRLYANEVKQGGRPTGAEQEPPAKAATGETIRVKRKSDGKVGSMPAANFDASKYDKL
jgi:hypothetical protein